MSECLGALATPFCLPGGRGGPQAPPASPRLMSLEVADSVTARSPGPRTEHRSARPHTADGAQRPSGALLSPPLTLPPPLETARSPVLCRRGSASEAPAQARDGGGGSATEGAAALGPAPEQVRSRRWLGGWACALCTEY